MAKRIRGAGSVYLRKNGRYAAEIKLDGKTRTFYGKTQKEAYDKMQQALYEQKQRTLITGPQQTVKQYLEYWLENVHKPQVRLVTYAGRRGVVKNHILPGLGHLKLRDLKPEHLEALYASKLGDGYKPGTIHLIHEVLSNALGHAVRRGLLTRNVCEVVSSPRVVKREETILTKEQAHTLMEVAKGHRFKTIVNCSSYDSEGLYIEVSRGFAWYEVLVRRVAAYTIPTIWPLRKGEIGKFGTNLLPKTLAIRTEILYNERVLKGHLSFLSVFFVVCYV